jgi:hypothetical protein
MIWNKPLTMLWTISFMRGLPALIEPAYDAENLFVLRSLCDFYTYGNILNSQCGVCSLSSFLQRLSVVLDRRMGAGRAAPISDRKSEQELRFSTISSPRNVREKGRRVVFPPQSLQRSQFAFAYDLCACRGSTTMSDSPT